MDDLMDLIRAQDELREVEYRIEKLKIAEEDYVEVEEYEKAQLMLNEQKRLRRRRTILKKKLQVRKILNQCSRKYIPIRTR